jgi:transposase
VPTWSPTKLAQPDRPVQVEYEYKRAGALQLFCAFDTRTGRVYGRTYRRKRQIEFIDFLEYLDRTIPACIAVIHIVCDNVSTHHGKRVRAWLDRHPRFTFHFLPVHCSRMNPVEQWFSILPSKASRRGRLRRYRRPPCSDRLFHRAVERDCAPVQLDPSVIRQSARQGRGCT